MFPAPECGSPIYPWFSNDISLGTHIPAALVLAWNGPRVAGSSWGGAGEWNSGFGCWGGAPPTDFRKPLKIDALPKFVG